MNSQSLDFGVDKIRSRLQLKLGEEPSFPDGDFLLNPDLQDAIIERAVKPAAVLIGLIEREGEAQVILTKRTEALSSHSGQIAFPGGKIDEDDASPEAAALREAWEEIGLDINEVDVVGSLPDYHSGSGFLISPVLGIVRPGADFDINTDEVEYMFEVPLRFLMDAQNHKLGSKTFAGGERHYYEMPYEGHYIWGVTAGMIRVLHDRVFAHESA